MLEFLIALFGGLKYFAEKAEFEEAQSDYERRAKAHYRREEVWLAKVIDKNLENQLEDFIYHRENYDAVWQEVSEAFAEMPWNKDRTRMYFSPDDVARDFGVRKFTKKERENIAANHRQEALRIMMARRGKLCYYDAYWGIENTGYLAPTTLMMNQLNENTSRFILWINTQLKKHGIDEKVYIEVAGGSAYPVESSLQRQGKYMWEPRLSMLAKIKS